MWQPALSPHGDHLAQGNSSIVWWNPLVPVRQETLLPHPVDRAFRQVAILKATAGQDDALVADTSRNGDDGLGQAIVKPSGDFPHGNFAVQIGKNVSDNGRPVQDDGQG